jgi:hypothetical protein
MLRTTPHQLPLELRACALANLANAADSRASACRRAVYFSALYGFIM